MPAKVTRLVDSCLMVTGDDGVTLIDPGVHTWESNDVNLDAIERVDRILITHEHADHVHLPFVRHLRARFPEALIETNDRVAQLLEEEDIDATTSSSGATSQFAAPHELTPNGEAPPNVGFHIGDVVTHPGDSYQVTDSRKLLALPVSPPWGSMTAAMVVSKRLHPRVVIPIHDWHITAAGRDWMYSSAKRVLAKSGIEFAPLGHGESLEV